MKKVFFIVSILAYCFKANAQQSEDEYKSMVDSAISIMYTRYSDVIKKQNRDYYLNNLYLLNEQNQPLNYVPSSRKFKLINVYDDQNRKIIKEGINAWKVFTVLNKNRFVVSIVDFYITYKGHNYNFANGGGSTTIFEYFCDKNEWRLISFENRGI